jgi:hypothetical protein
MSILPSGQSAKSCARARREWRELSLTQSVCSRFRVQSSKLDVGCSMPRLSQPSTLNQARRIECLILGRNKPAGKVAFHVQEHIRRLPQCHASLDILMGMVCILSNNLVLHYRPRRSVLALVRHSMIRSYTTSDRGLEIAMNITFDHATPNLAIALWLHSTRPVGQVADPMHGQGFERFSAESV